jgi:hypothetical protein
MEQERSKVFQNWNTHVLYFLPVVKSDALRASEIGDWLFKQASQAECIG